MFIVLIKIIAADRSNEKKAAAKKKKKESPYTPIRFASKHVPPASKPNEDDTVYEE